MLSCWSSCTHCELQPKFAHEFCNKVVRFSLNFIDSLLYFFIHLSQCSALWGFIFGLAKSWCQKYMERNVWKTVGSVFAITINQLNMNFLINIMPIKKFDAGSKVPLQQFYPNLSIIFTRINDNLKLELDQRKITGKRAG